MTAIDFAAFVDQLATVSGETILPFFRTMLSVDNKAGQRGFPQRNARFYPHQFKIEQDARTPGAQGPTFRGRARVPRGQTYTAVPETGEYADMPAASRRCPRTPAKF